MTIRLPRLGADPHAPFPPVELALEEPNGLLACGGDLHPRRLLQAYAHGIFPWYSQGEPILWWSPDPRTVFDTHAFALPRRLRRALKASAWTVTADTDFAQVIDACAKSPRSGQHGTWIGPAMRTAYLQLHDLGHAHSIEVRDGGRLVGGLYGVMAGGAFAGESMFSAASGGSKVALGALCRRLAGWGVAVLDAQVQNPHLASLGALQMPRRDYLRWLSRHTPAAAAPGSWAERWGSLRAHELA